MWNILSCCLSCSTLSIRLLLNCWIVPGRKTFTRRLACVLCLCKCVKLGIDAISVTYMYRRAAASSSSRSVLSSTDWFTWINRPPYITRVSAGSGAEKPGRPIMKVPLRPSPLTPPPFKIRRSLYVRWKHNQRSHLASLTMAGCFFISR